MTEFLGLLASIAVLAFTWKAVVRSRSTQRHGRFLRHALGFSAGFFAGVVALLFVIDGMHWITFATALGFGWFSTYRKQPAHDTLTPRETEANKQQFETEDSIDREQRTIDEWNADLTTIWAGDTATISFTYQNNEGDRSRRQVDVDEIQLDRNGEIYLIGLCHRRGERRTFRASRIDSDIRAKGRRLDPFEWVEEVTGHQT